MITTDGCRTVLLGCAVWALAACGGGGGSAPAASNPPPAPVSPPVITAQPVPASAITGAIARFSVEASGAGLSYQWYRNGVAIAGATAAAYDTDPLAAADHGAAYNVLVANAGGKVASQVAPLSLVLSDDQRLFESLALAPASGAHTLRWNLNLAGAPAASTDYLYSERATLAASPLTLGAQRITVSSPHNLTASLVMPSPQNTRVLKDGAILVVPGSGGASLARYAGAAVEIDTLAQDARTVAFSQRRSGYASVALTGLLVATPADFAQWHNSLFANPVLTRAGAGYAAGAGYLRYTAHAVGDRYTVFDCGAPSSGAEVSPCLTNTSLTDALAAGIPSASDGVTYRLAEGTLGTVAGVPVWVATVLRPMSSTWTLTQQFRFYFAMNGHVYTGALIKDGTLLGGSYYVSRPGGASVLDRLSFLPYHIRLNQAAVDSVGGAFLY